MSDSVRPHRRQPTRLPRPWDSPGKNTGVGCHCLLQCMKVKSESEVASRVPLLATPGTAAYQAPPCMGFPRQEYWSGVPLPSPGTFARLRQLFPGLRSILQLCSSLFLYSTELYFHHQSHPQLGVVFTLAPSLHSFWCYFSTLLQ